MSDDDVDKELGAWFRDNEDLLYKMVHAQFNRLTVRVSPDDVEMAVADAMWRAWQYRHLYRGGNIKAWLSSVVGSSCLALLREHMMEQRRHDNYVERLGARGTHTVPPHEQTYVMREQIREGLAVMDATSQRAVLLSFMGYDRHEIASEMGVSFIQVMHALARGRAEARKRNDVHVRRKGTRTL